MTMCIADKVKVVALQSSVNVTATSQTASSDLRGIAHQGLRVSLETATALTVDVNDLSIQLQHSDDNSVWSDAAYVPAKLMSSLAAGEELSIGYEGIKRYIRLSYVATGSPDVDVSVYAILQPEHLPA